MSLRRHRLVALPRLMAARLGRGALLVVACCRSAEAQVVPLDNDRIDITGRQNLTVGAGARAYGMGGAFLARADDATAASWNPAGLSYLLRPELTLVGASTAIRVEQPLRNAPQEAQFMTDRFDGRDLDFAAFTLPLGWGSIDGAVQVSYQRAILFGGTRQVEEFAASATTEGGDPQQALTITRRDDIESRGGFDVVAVGAGFRLARRLRVGFTYNRWLGGHHQSLTRTILVPSAARPVRELEFEFRPHGWNVNYGLMWSPVDSLNLGAVYKTWFAADVDLRKVRHDSWGTLDDLTDVTTNSHARDDVILELPASFGFGLSWRPRDTFTVSADVTRTAWSESRILRYFQLSPTVVGGERPAPTVYDARPYPLVTGEFATSDPTGQQSQQDAQQLRAGVEWVLLKGRLRIPLRAGYFSDQQIERIVGGSTPRLSGYTAGLGLAVGPLLLDVAYVYERGSYSVTVELDVAEDGSLVPPVLRTSNRASTGSRRVHASVIYRFGGRH